MFVGTDVGYHADHALAAAVVFAHVPDASATREVIERVNHVAPYVPGEFYRRELPCLLQVLARVNEPLDAVIVDGYVWLDDAGRAGLGAHLYEALGRAVPVVGVAKTAFAGASGAVPVLRGQSHAPLYVTAAGMGVMDAAAMVRAMHGDYRVPTLLRRVDRLSRGGP